LKIIAVCACPMGIEKELSDKEIEEATVIIVAVGVNVADILEDNSLRNKVCEICGHYTYEHKDVKRDITILYGNMSVLGIDGNRYVLDKIKNSIDRYVQCFNLQGLTSKLLH